MKKLLIIFLILTLTLCASLVSCGGPAPSGNGTSAPTEDGSSDGSTPPAQIVTDENGEAVTNESGEVVTALPEPETEIEIVTDENGETVTDKNGEVVTDVIVNTPTEGNDASDNGENNPENEESNPENNESNPENNESNPETEEDAPNAEPPVAPAEKSPFALYDAAYRTVSNLTNGTLYFEMLAVKGTYSSTQTAILKICGNTYLVQGAETDPPFIWVDGVMYDVSEKTATPMDEEAFCKDALPYYPFSNAMFPLTEAHFAGVSFVEANGEISFAISFTSEEYSALTGAPLSETLTEMLYTVTFDEHGVMKSAVAAASFHSVDEKTGEEDSYSTTLTVKLSDLGALAPITAPEDASEYETDGADNEQNGGEIVVKPEAGKDPTQGEKDEHEQEDENKVPENNDPPQATPDDKGWSDYH